MNKKVIILSVLVIAVQSFCTFASIPAFLLARPSSNNNSVVTPISPIIHNPKTAKSSKVYSIKKDGLEIEVRLGNDKLSNSAVNSEKQKAYMLVTLRGKEAANNTVARRSPLNLSFVLDKSGSMSGEKLEYVKEAVKKAADYFRPGDRISLVTYDSTVNTIYNNTSFINCSSIECRYDNFDTELFTSRIEGITSGSSTYLEGGLREGLDHVLKSQLSEKAKNSRVILLSDGLANVGVSDPYQLGQIVKEKIENNDITVSTIGVGADYDEHLMTQVARAGRGNYYFLENPEDTSRIFDTELESVTSTIAKDIKVEFNLDHNFKVTRGIGYELENESYFRPYDICSGKEVNYLFEIEPMHLNNYENEKVTMANLDIEYISTQTNQIRKVNIPITLDMVESNINVLADNTVYDEYIQGTIAEYEWSVFEDLDKRRNPEAIATLNEAIDLLENANKRLAGKYDKKLKELRQKRDYTKNLGDKYINESSGGRSFQKSNQNDSFQKKYNK